MSLVKAPSLPPLKKSIAPRAKKPSDKYLLNINDYEVVHEIKNGGFGVVNLVRHKRSMEELAAKTNHTQTGPQNTILVSREIRILIQIQHPTVIQFRGFSYTDFENKKKITIFMDYMNKGSLADLISNEQKGLCPSNYDNTKRQIILIGIARGMMILHNRHVIHRDIKPENILLDNNLYPRITDFGLSKFFDPHHSMSQSTADTGTAQYMAPEVIQSDHFNTKADVYAFGILMYELITGRRAYENLLKGPKRINIFQLKQKVCSGLRPPIESGIMKKGQKIMIEKCWSNDPKERPTFNELFKKLSMSCDDYFTEFEGNGIEQNVIFVDDDDDENEQNEDDENFEMIGSKKFCFNDVDIGEILDYIDHISVESRTFDRHEERKIPEVDMTKIESKISSLEAELAASKSETSKLKKETNQMIAHMNKTIQDQAALISSLKSELAETKKASLSSSSATDTFLSAELDLSSPGLLAQLKQKEKTPFDRLFIPSLSTRDVYNLINPNSSDFYCIYKGDYIEFELEYPVDLNGIQIFAYSIGFPKSFDITINGKMVKSIEEATELNKCLECMTINFDSIQSKKIRLKSTGVSWDDNDFIYIRKLEFLSTEPKYSQGLFSTLVKDNKNDDIHRTRVYIFGSDFSLHNLHKIDSNIYCSSTDIGNEWIQIELTQHTAILTGVRIKSCSNRKLRNFKIICTNDVNKPLSSWTTLLSINEKSKNEHKQLDIYKFPNPSPPTRFIRIILTGPNWDDTNFLQLYHFDIFGSLSIDKTIERNTQDISEIKSKLGRFISVDLDINSPGIIYQLKLREKNKFDRLFVASMDSNDIYGITDPNTKDYFNTTGGEYTQIEIELEESVMIKGVQIFTANSPFPKSFDILVDGKTVKSIVDANELNGSNRSMTISFSSIRCKKVCFKQTSKAWDRDCNSINIKRIELLSTESKYSNGVFSTLVKESENQDPHKSRVFITSSCFDFNNFYLMKLLNPIYTCDKNAWFQIELTKYTAILTGFRLRKSAHALLRNFKLICTDNINKPLSSWITLIEINEKTENEHDIHDIYEFPHPSPPVRFIRLAKTGFNWKNNNDFVINNFDLYGCCF